MTRERRKLVPPVALLAIVAGCVDPAGTELSAPAYLDPSGGHVVVDFQEGDIVIGSQVWSRCRGWQADELPPGDPVLVDIYFSQGPSQPVPSFFPELETGYVQEIRDIGAEIVAEFNTSVVRAWLPRASMDFGPDTKISHVRSVPDPHRRDIRMWLLHKPGEGTQVLEKFVQLGGVVLRDYSQRYGEISGVFPDPALPELLAPGWITHVFVPLDGCVLSAGHAEEESGWRRISVGRPPAN